MQWNIFDTVLVTAALVDFLGGLLMAKKGAHDLVVMRILRLCKVAKIIRAIRAMRFFNDLAVLMDTFRSATVALFWTIVMLVFVFYVFSLMFMSGLAQYMVVQGDELDPDVKMLVHASFGTMPRSMLSLYKVLTGGEDWNVYYKLVEAAGMLYAASFVFFVFFAHLAVMNILTGMIVEKSVRAAAPDREQLVLQQRVRSRQDAYEFRNAWKMLDHNRSGTISWRAFKVHMESEAMVAYMASLGLEVHEVELFFHMVAGSSSASVTIDQFVEGCLQMKGNATGIAMQCQLFETNQLRAHLTRFEQANSQTMKFCVSRIDEVVAKCSAMVAASSSHCIKL